MIKIFMGLPATTFWELVEKVAANEASYQEQRLQRAQRQRAFGGGRPPDLPLAIRLALLLTYLRLHLTQEAVAALYAEATQSDVSRQLRILLPLLAQLLPTPELWDKIDESQPLTPPELLAITQLRDGRVIIDATEQQVYRSEVSAVRKAHYSGKKKQFTLKTQVVTDGDHHIVAITITIPGATNDKKLADEVATIKRLPDDCQGAADKAYQGVQAQVQTRRKVDPQTGETSDTPRLTFDTPFKNPEVRSCPPTTTPSTKPSMLGACALNIVSDGQKTGRFFPRVFASHTLFIRRSCSLFAVSSIGKPNVGKLSKTCPIILLPFWQILILTNLYCIKLLKSIHASRLIGTFQVLGRVQRTDDNQFCQRDRLSSVRCTLDNLA